MSDMEEGELSDHGEEFPPPDPPAAGAAHPDAPARFAGRLDRMAHPGVRRSKTFGGSAPGFGPLQVTFKANSTDLPVSAYL